MTSERRRICWITPDYFFAVDAPVMPSLIEQYDVDWFVIHTHGGRSERLTNGLRLDCSCPQRSITLRYRQRDPRIVAQYLELANEIHANRYDLVYTSFHGLPYFLPILAARVDVDKIIYGVHNASTPRGASNEWAMTLYHRYVFRRLRRFHVFSEYQLEAIKALAPDGTHYCAPFRLVDYGPPKALPPEDTIRFLAFGYIRRYKRLDLLIKAFQQLRDRVTRPIELHIVGACDDWGMYQHLIGSDPAIVTRVELIPAADIPDVVGSCHYLVLPYQDIAQSAVLKLAFDYGKPVIVSNIDGFKQSIVEEKTGFFFESGSVDHLSTVMQDVIEQHHSRYGGMQESVRQLVAREYSVDAVVRRYRAFIDDVVEPRRA